MRQGGVILAAGRLGSKNDEVFSPKKVYLVTFVPKLGTFKSQAQITRQEPCDRPEKTPVFGLRPGTPGFVFFFV